MSSTTLPQTQRQPRRGRVDGWHVTQLVLSVLTLIAMPLVMGAALLYALPAVNLAGDEQYAQRIFYIHMGCNFAALAAFMMSLIGSIVYLTTRDLDWDRVTQASIESGTIFALGLTVSGAIWARPTWNTYWTWDPRLTTVTITILIYAAYLLFRNGIDNRRTRALFGNIYALFAFLSIPLTYYSARWFRSIHPVVWDGANEEAQGGFNIGTTMNQTLTVSLIGFLLLFSTLMILRWRQLRVEDHIEDLREELES